MRLHIFLLVFWGLAALPGVAQDHPRRNPVPLPEFARYMQPNPRYVVGRLIPLGFSVEGGKLAFVQEEPDEACGCYLFEFHILNLASNHDEYVKKVEVQNTSRVEWDRVWQKHGAELVAAMQKHGIAPATLQALPLPIATPNGTVRSRVTGSWRQSEMGTGERYLTTAQVWMGNRASGEQRVASYHLQDEYVLGMEPRWYLESPSGRQIAILLLRVDRGWEGPPNPVRLQVVGASLDMTSPVR